MSLMFVITYLLEEYYVRLLPLKKKGVMRMKQFKLILDRIIIILFLLFILKIAFAMFR